MTFDGSAVAWGLCLLGHTMTTTQPDQPDLVSIDEAAEIICCHPRTIRRWVNQGWLTGYRFGPRILRVDRAELAPDQTPRDLSLRRRTEPAQDAS